MWGADEEEEVFSEPIENQTPETKPTKNIASTTLSNIQSSSRWTLVLFFLACILILYFLFWFVQTWVIHIASIRMMRLNGSVAEPEMNFFSAVNHYEQLVREKGY
jgi:hypothetical protein